MKEQDVLTLYYIFAQEKHVRDIYILVDVVQTKQEEDIPANIPLAIPYLPSNRFCPVYITISPPHRSESERWRLNLWTLCMTVIRDHLTVNRTSNESYEMKDYVFPH